MAFASRNSLLLLLSLLALLCVGSCFRCLKSGDKLSGIAFQLELESGFWEENDLYEKGCDNTKNCYEIFGKSDCEIKRVNGRLMAFENCMTAIIYINNPECLLPDPRLNGFQGYWLSGKTGDEFYLPKLQLYSDYNSALSIAASWLTMVASAILFWA